MTISGSLNPFFINEELPLAWDRPLEENKRLLKVKARSNEDDLHKGCFEYFTHQEISDCKSQLKNGEKLMALGDAKKISLIAVYKKMWEEK